MDSDDKNQPVATSMIAILAKLLDNLGQNRFDQLQIDGLKKVFDEMNRQVARKFEKLTECQFSGCIEINYYKKILKELTQHVPVLLGGKVLHIPIYQVHSIGLRFENQPKDCIMVRLFNGEVHILEDRSLSKLKVSFQHLLFEVNRHQLFSWYTFNGIRKEGNFGYIKIRDWGDVELRISKEKYDLLIEEKNYFDQFINS